MYTDWPARVGAATVRAEVQILTVHDMGTAFQPGVNDFVTRRPELVNEWSPRNSFSPETVAAGSGRAAWWVCSTCGHEWMASIYSRGLRSTGCRTCANRAQRTRVS